MQAPENPILVTGAAGALGGAAARHLLQRGSRVRALCRDPERPAARALAEAGVRVARGDLTALEIAATPSRVMDRPLRFAGRPAEIAALGGVLTGLVHA